MVLREYKCLSCGKSVTVLHKTSVEIVPGCEFCSGELEKKISSFSAIASSKFDSLNEDYVFSPEKIDDKKFLVDYKKKPLAVIHIQTYEVKKLKNPNFN